MFDFRLVLILCLLFVLLPRPMRGKKGGAYFGVAWLVLLAIAIVTTVLAAVLAPKPKAPKPASATDLEDPTNDAGREMGVIFGEGVYKSGNYLWFGEKGVNSYKVKA